MEIYEYPTNHLDFSDKSDIPEYWSDDEHFNKNQ
jgi:hypothetical protein